MSKPKLFLLSLIIFTCLLSPWGVRGQSGQSGTDDGGPSGTSGGGQSIIDIKSAFIELICSVGLWGKCATPDQPPAPVEPRVLVLRVVQTILGFVSLLAMIIIIYAGVLWITSAGVPDKIKKARGLLIWAFIGLVVLMSAWTLISYVIYAASKITG